MPTQERGLSRLACHEDIPLLDLADVIRQGIVRVIMHD